MLAIFKYNHDLSDEVMSELWVRNPYFQLFCGKEFFQHRLTFDSFSMTRWRQRTQDEKLTALPQESLASATTTSATYPPSSSDIVVKTA